MADTPPSTPDVPQRGLVRSLIKLARPKQWSKSAFVFIGPVYSLADGKGEWRFVLWAALVTASVLALVSSACYIINDMVDAPKDRLHPRKKRRPIASGAVTPGQAKVFAAVLVAIALAGVFLLDAGPSRWWVLGLAVAYVVNVNSYSYFLKRKAIADVLSLSLGFVIRVLAGCAAAGVTPSTWLLNSTLFLAMFLAFGKRLGERRTVEDAGAIRDVQQTYTDDLLRMSVVVTGVATLITYAGYIQSRDAKIHEAVVATIGDAPSFIRNLNLLWFTMLPATYGLLRCIVLLERGRYDDPTELATKDMPTQVVGIAFAFITLFVLFHKHIS